MGRRNVEGTGFGGQMKEERINRRETQQQVAIALGMSRATISAIEHNKQNVGEKHIIEVIKYYGIDINVGMFEYKGRFELSALLRKYEKPVLNMINTLITSGHWSGKDIKSEVGGEWK